MLELQGYTYTITVPERRALATLVQGGRLFAAPMTRSNFLDRCGELLNSDIQLQQLG